MFDIAWSELALIAAVALIVIGPKDLPRVMRSLGQWTRRARLMASEFQRNLDDMLRDSELHDLKRDVESIAPSGLKSKIEDMIDAKSIEDGLKIEVPPPLPPDPQPGFAPPPLVADPPPVTPDTAVPAATTAPAPPPVAEQTP